jgi:chromosome partitioning protein
MKSLAVVSQKGGVGKTTLSLNLAFSLARSGFRVALIDADPQGAVGHSLQGVRPSAGLAGFMSQGEAIEHCLLRTRLAELAIMPVGEVPAHESPTFFHRLEDGRALSRALDTLGADFDLVIIDTPSGFNGATLGALRAADSAITPLQAEPVALRTLPQLLSVVGSLREQGARVQLAAVVLCMLQQRNNDSLAVAEEVWARMPAELVLEATIPRDAAVLAASSAGVPLGLLSPRRPAPMSLVFDRLASELAPRIGLATHEEDAPLGLFA